MTLNPVDVYRWLRAWCRIIQVDLATRYQMHLVRKMVEADQESIAIARDAISKWQIDAEIREAGLDGLYCDGCQERHSALVFTNPNSNHAKEFLCAGCFLDSLLAEVDRELASIRVKNA